MSTASKPAITLENVPCPLCGAPDHQLMVEARDDHCGVPGTFTAVRCGGCRHIYMNPRPAAESMAACYPDHYAPHQAVLTPIEEAQGANAQSANKPATAAPRPLYLRILPLRYVPGLRRLYEFLLDDRSQPLPDRTVVQQSCGLQPNQPLHALEVGCATGSYLQKLSGQGWSVTGIEPGATPASAAQKAGLNVHCGTLDSVTLPEQSFEVAALWMVLEHVPEPLTTLSQLFRLLRPGGLLMFSIPNAGCWQPGILGRNWYVWELPRHLQYFTPSSIERALKECGFCHIRIIHQRTLLNLVGSIGIALLRWRPSSRLGQWLMKYPGRPTIWGQLLLAPAAHLLSWVGQGERLTILASRPQESVSDSK